MNCSRLVDLPMERAAHYHVVMKVQGYVEPRFQAVQDAFERNLQERGEVGASVCVVVEGETVVDLWGGIADRNTDRAWDKDTISLVWSCTKGAAALCAHILRDRGLLDFDAPVVRYWPEFGQAGKEAIPVRWLLDHQAGLPVLRQPVKPGGLYDWDYLVDLLAKEAPCWEPGTRQGYHAFTFGHLVGEVVRRVSGQRFERFLREAVTEPLGLDFYVGLPEEHEGRVASTIRPDLTPKGETPTRFMARTTSEPDSIQALAVRNTGRRPGNKDIDSREAHAAVLPSSGGITNARGLAGLYAPLALGGEHKGARLLSAGAAAELGKVSAATACDAVLLIGLRCASGFWKSTDNRAAPPGAQDSMILSEAAFGHPGMGGSIGFADPKARMSFGYSMNKQGRGVCLNERGQSLVDATYRALGCQTDRCGSWE